MDASIVVFCTVPSAEVGEKIAEDLVGRSVAACVNIVPGLVSIYRWEGKICRDGELLLLIKTRKSLFSAVRDRISALHSYEVPEIIAMDICAGSEPYLAWLADNTNMPREVDMTAE